MKRLLALSAVLIPIYLFAQGFGSFSHDQPYFAKDAVSGGTGYATNLLYRWVSSDMTNGQISYWDDRLQGRRLAPNINTTVTNSSDGVVMHQPDYGSLTNGANATIDPATNYSWGIMLNPNFWPDGTLFSVFGTSTDGTAAFVVQNVGGTVRLMHSRSGGGDITIFPGRIPHSSYTDILFARTNASKSLVFTNGVFCYSWEDGAGGQPLFFNVGSWGDGGSYYDLEGMVREVWVRTNTIVDYQDALNGAIDLHYTRTNLYGL